MDLDACVRRMPNNFSDLLAGGNHPLFLLGRGDHRDATASLIHLTAILQDEKNCSHLEKDIVISVNKRRMAVRQVKTITYNNLNRPDYSFRNN